MSQEGGRKILSVNRKARFDYTIVENLECGMELKGTEVKSMKEIRFSFPDAYAKIENGELYLVGLHVNVYPQGNVWNHDPDRVRKLLVHKQEVKRLRRQVDEKNLTLVPLSFYLRRGIVKCDLGICKGKRERDKREDIKKRDLKRDVQRELRKFS
jgi:SsrA-binding protein